MIGQFLNLVIGRWVAVSELKYLVSSAVKIGQTESISSRV